MQNAGIKENKKPSELFRVLFFEHLFLCFVFSFFLIWDSDEKSQEELQNILSKLSKKTCILKSHIN